MALAFEGRELLHKEGKIMEIVLLTALGVGGATVIGALICIAFKGLLEKFSDYILSFSAGVMLAAAILGLILPSLENGGRYPLATTVIGIFAGATFLNLIDILVPHFHKVIGGDVKVEDGNKLDKILMFVMAIAVHNIPEGIASGVGFGAGNTAQALFIAGSIALHNIPVGMIIIAPMLASGVPMSKAVLTVAMTGAVEVVSTLVGYFAVNVSSAILPFALAFAGGTMLCVVCNEIIPETHTHNGRGSGVYSLLTGFCIMLTAHILIG